MKRLITFIFALVLITQSMMASEQEILKRDFLSKIDDVVLIVENKQLSKDTRNDKIVQVLTPMFDFELMAKLSLGKVWRTLSKETGDKFISLYVKRMKKSYSSKIDAYSDEKVEVTKIEQPKKSRIALVTNLVSKTNKLEIVYKFHKPRKLMLDKNRWLIYDVEILGVSILKTDKAQFREFLKTHKIEELMEKM
ncbi:MAG: ABC transporter substrate-binding protein [Campylobacterota bacterium]|nr:ABC transporter substrate-binding protein [Campylobacterota bacterium]